MEQPLTDLASRRGGGSLLLRGLLVLGAIIVAILFAAELLLHVIDFSGPSRFELGEAFQFDPELGWVPVPNAAERQTYDFGKAQQPWTARARAERYRARPIPLSRRLVHLWL